jgi:tRNA modification GTPase
MEDTIVAISTAIGVGAISIVRLSGKEAINIVNSCFSGEDLSKARTHTIHYGNIVDGLKKIDEVLVSIMFEPKTFTRENIVEINCHGGIATTQKVLELMLKKGARLAEPGEFTKRAFLNGRIDLVEAEAVMDLINAKTEEAREIALNQVDGQSSKMIRELRQEIIKILANIEVNIDYPEYEDIEMMTNSIIKESLIEIKNKITLIIKESKNGQLIKEGIDTAIIGRPNVGKSSLLNKLINEEKAIVTEIAGTTRDIVEGKLNLDGIIINVIDTAGIRKTNDVVEKIGVSKSLEMINRADLILYVLDNNEALTKEDEEIIEKIKEKNHIIIINKVDLENKLDINKIASEKRIFMSAINNQGLHDLKEKIKKMFEMEQINTKDFTYLTSARSISILEKSLDLLKDIEDAIEKDMPIDMIEIDIKKIWDNLGEIVGETYQEELIDQLFSQFCLGK